MAKRTHWCVAAFMSSFVLLSLESARADWILIDDFDAYSVGDSIDGLSNGEGDWVSGDFDFYGIDADPVDPANQVLAAFELDGGEKQTFLYDDRLEVRDGSTATLFARFYRADPDTHVNFGLSDVDSPTTWGDFESQFRDQTGIPFARNGGEFTPFDNVDELPEGEWINYWIVINNDDDTNEYYIQSATEITDQLKLTADGEDVFDFRNGTDDSLTTFFLRTNNQAPFIHFGPWYLDDIYIDVAGENLSNPTDEVGGLVGDFNDNGALDIADINALSVEASLGTNSTKFDVTGDDIVDEADLAHWAIQLAGTWIGDANLDGEFNSGDFVQVFTAGLFESNQPANWSEGDWNGSGIFDSGDFVAAFTDGGFEMGPRVSPAAVPEPSTALLALFAIASLVFAARKRASCR